jgi:hypothetical protein
MFMEKRRTVRAQVRLAPCLTALRVLAKSNDASRPVLIERQVDDYLRPFSLAYALKRLHKAIHDEASERQNGEDWSIAKNYVRSLPSRMT